MHTYTSPPLSARKARELLTTSGGAPKPEPELWVRVAQQALALGDLAGSIISMLMVDQRRSCVGPDRGVPKHALGPASERQRTRLIHLQRAQPCAELICTCKGFKISSNCSHER